MNKAFLTGKSNLIKRYVAFSLALLLCLSGVFAGGGCIPSFAGE